VSDNGNEPRVQRLVLSLTTDPWQLTIEGETENLNVAMAMIEEARRVFDMKWRMGAAQEAKAEQDKAAQELGRVHSILKRGAMKQ
jgi:hypothetical protein